MTDTIIQLVNTALLSTVATLAWIIYRDMQKRITRMDRQIMACLSTLIAIVNHIEHLPEYILNDLHEALKER